MSNTPDNTVQFTLNKHQKCYMAYTLNDTQPVRCTIIGEQPLFFMDFDGDVAEEEALLEKEYGAALDDDFGFDAIEDGLMNLTEQIKETNALLSSFGDEFGANEAIEGFLDDSAFAIKQGEKEYVLSIDELTLTLERSRFAKTLLEFAKEHGTELTYNKQIQTALYDRRGGQIALNPFLPKEEQILLAAKELRRVWQHRNGALLNPLTFHPDQAILINRAQAADLATSIVRIAWELQLANIKEPWEHLEKSSMADLTRAFARESHLDFRALNNGTASGAVFEAWFLSERPNGEDKKLIHQMLADYRGYVFEGEATAQQVTMQIISALGSVPFGKNYLATYAQVISEDQLFSEVRERSNANFLWFIKFERTFREAEQELQSTDAVEAIDESFGDLQGDKNKKDIRIGTNEKTADIITLPYGSDSAASSQKSKRRAGSRSNIVEFGRDSEE